MIFFSLLSPIKTVLKFLFHRFNMGRALNAHAALNSFRLPAIGTPTATI